MKYLSVDLETLGFDPDKFVCGCVIRDDQPHKPRMFDKPKEMYDYIIECGMKKAREGSNLVVYAHNHEFDWYRYKGYLDERAEIYCLYPFIVRLQLKTERKYGGKIIFLGTDALFRSSLADIGKSLNYPKFETPQELYDQNYIHPIQLPMIKSYCIRDTEIVYKTVKRVHELANDVNMRPNTIYTLGQLSANHFIQTLYNDERFSHFFGEQRIPTFIKPTLRADNTITKGLRGGRVQIFDQGWFSNVHDIDINNFYSWSALNHPFPDISTETIVLEPKNSIINEMGISTCLISIPKQLKTIGVLPVRTGTKSDMEVYYPNHECHIYGTWTNQELRLAVKTGHKIIYIKESVIYKENKHNPFTDIITRLYNKRLEYDQGSMERYFYKQLQNHMIGKFAQKTELKSYKMDKISNANSYKKNGYDILNRIGFNNIYMKQTGKVSKKRFYMPIATAMVNGNARVRIFNEMNKLNKKDLLYVDTDGFMYIDSESTKNSEKFIYNNDIGMFKKVKSNVDLLIYNKKAHMIDNDIKLSGVPKIFINKEDFVAGKISYKQQTSILNAKHVEDIGVFKDYEANLKKNAEEWKTKQETLENISIFIDIAENEEVNVDHVIKLIKKSTKCRQS